MAVKQMTKQPVEHWEPHVCTNVACLGDIGIQSRVVRITFVVARHGNNTNKKKLDSPYTRQIDNALVANAYGQYLLLTMHLATTMFIYNARSVGITTNLTNNSTNPFDGNCGLMVPTNSNKIMKQHQRSRKHANIRALQMSVGNPTHQHARWNSHNRETIYWRHVKIQNGRQLETQPTGDWNWKFGCGGWTNAKFMGTKMHAPPGHQCRTNDATTGWESNVANAQLQTLFVLCILQRVSSLFVGCPPQKQHHHIAFVWPTTNKRQNVGRGCVWNMPVVGHEHGNGGFYVRCFPRRNHHTIQQTMDERNWRKKWRLECVDTFAQNKPTTPMPRKTRRYSRCAKNGRRQPRGPKRSLEFAQPKQKCNANAPTFKRIRHWTNKNVVRLESEMWLRWLHRCENGRNEHTRPRDIGVKQMTAHQNENRYLHE